jgi:dihydrofolate synthase/folylpolyglutamate synthase
VDYSSVERYLESFVNYEVIPGFGFASAGYDLDHVHELLRRLGDPHWAPCTVHVAGSKGKGSVAAMVAGALSACGHITGLYTSPHLLHLGERIRVDGACVSPGELEVVLQSARPHLEALLAEPRWRRLTYFEILTVLAFCYFRDKKVDIQVLEVGLGGRLDATNVVTPDVCVIAPISLEHTAVLGDTIEKIAREKAGIIKPGAIVVSAPQPPAAARVIEAVCRDKGVQLVRVGEDVCWRVASHDLSGQSVRVDGPFGERSVRVPLAGSFQAENTATAVTALEELRVLGLCLDERCMARGLGDVEWPGRFQVLREHPLLVLDGAHNAASMRRLAESLDALEVRGRTVLVLGCSGDKDIEGAAAELVRLGGRFVVTRSTQARAAEPRDVAARLIGLGVSVVTEMEPGRALIRAAEMAGKDGMVCVTGSLYLVADVLRLWQEEGVRKHWDGGPPM